MIPIRGPLRADVRTKTLVKRLKPGDIAVIHHQDLDSTAARSLVECRVAAVVNAAPSISGRYPNRGPSALLEAGIPQIDAVGDAAFRTLQEREGKEALIEEAVIRMEDGFCVQGRLLSPGLIRRLMEEARQNLSAELDGFARNTLAYLEDEKSILLDPVDLPPLQTALRGKHVLVVVRGEGYKDDLRCVVDYLDEMRPILIAVDGGADALLEMGYRPHLIVGDMDSVSDRALRCGAELVAHAYPDAARESPGVERLKKLGLQAHVFQAPGTSEDIAMLLADEAGASLIVAVGAHFSLEEFLDKGRGGMASTFLVRLRIGAKLVDAKGVARLWSRPRRPVTRELILLSAAALFPILMVALMSPWFRTVLQTMRLSLRSAFGM